MAGAVLTADYLRNVSMHFPLTIDVNHVGAARFFNPTAAANAISATSRRVVRQAHAAASPEGCLPLTNYRLRMTARQQSTISPVRDWIRVSPCSEVPRYRSTPAGPLQIRTWERRSPEQNPLMGVGDFEEPIGRSVYNALQTEFKQSMRNPFPYADSMNLQVAYTLSRFVGNGGNDQNFSALAWDNDNPTRYMGPTSLDRLNQFKFGWTVDVAHHGPEFSVIAGFSSAPPTTLRWKPIAARQRPAKSSARTSPETAPSAICSPRFRGRANTAAPSRHKPH